VVKFCILIPFELMQSFKDSTRNVLSPVLLSCQQLTCAAAFAAFTTSVAKKLLCVPLSVTTVVTIRLLT